MFDGNDSKPGVEERYQTAGNTSDLTVEADRRGAGDVLIAAGWSPSRVGMALLRLHSEWDSAAKRRRQSGSPKMTPMTPSDLRLLANSLKSRPAVWAQIAPWIAEKDISPETAAEALLHWLDPTCRVCDGHGLRKVENQPALSARQCHKCHGTGHVPHPQGSAKMLSWMDDCVQKARQSLGKRLRPGG